MNKHTPGPWRVIDGHCPCPCPCMKEIVGPSFGITIVMWATDIDPNDYPVRSADANLVAAAPDLLEALQNMVQLYYGEDRQSQAGQYARAAVAAIAKAKGGEE